MPLRFDAVVRLLMLMLADDFSERMLRYALMPLLLSFLPVITRDLHHPYDTPLYNTRGHPPRILPRASAYGASRCCVLLRFFA